MNYTSLASPIVAIAPTDLRDFLSKAHGWTINPVGVQHRLYVHENANYPKRQLVFPMDESAPDYVESVTNVFEKLAVILKTSSEQLLASAAVAKEDVLRFRISSARADFQLPLSFAKTLISATEKLLKTAACSTLDPKLYYPRLSQQEAQHLIEKTHFNQTETGSFIIKLSCPLNAMDIQAKLHFESDASPFVRQVNYTLHQSLVQLVDAIETDTLTQLHDSLKSNANPLISSNLCEALAEMHNEDLLNALDVMFDWSMLQTVPEHYKKQSRIVLQRDYFGRIEELGRSLRPSESPVQNTFIGSVEQLNGTMQDSGNRAGEVVFALLYESSTIKAKANLNETQYAQAIEAHRQENAYIKIEGRLNAGRQPRQLDEMRQFEMIAQ